MQSPKKITRTRPMKFPEFVGVRMSAAEKQRLVTLARVRGCSPSEFVRSLLASIPHHAPAS